MPPSLPIIDRNNTPAGAGGEYDSNGNSAKGNTRPSDARRRELNEEVSVPTVSNFFPIERYYAVAQTSYEKVLEMYELKHWDEAYLFGKRYCTFVLDAIPNHHYYNSTTNPMYRTLKQKHTKQVANVLDLIAKIADAMDAEELELQRLEKERQERERAEQDRLAQLKFDELQRRVQLQKKKTTSLNESSNSRMSKSSGHEGNPNEVMQSALSKLALLQGGSIGGHISKNPSATSVQPSTSYNGDDTNTLGYGGTSTRYKLDLNESNPSYLPPPMLPPPILPPPLLPPPLLPPSAESSLPGSDQSLLPPPPAYESATGRRKIRNNNLDPPSVHCPNEDLDRVETTRKLSSRTSTNSQNNISKIVPIRTLEEQCRTRYIEYYRSKKIQVRGLDTYQGRIYDSTNGCTVISALIAASHLHPSVGPEGLSDSTICSIIDSKCGPILREIRSKLGLNGNALIIPSDVHDHFVDRKIFSQEQFAGAAGGNILDQAHYGEFLKLLSDGNDGKGARSTASATMFFREHVVSIIKIPKPGEGAYYDLIDSLPSGPNGKASRTRCTDVQSLEVLLQWYATRKLATNGSYIDKNVWVDSMADIDPRVFQGFVWMNVKQ